MTTRIPHFVNGPAALVTGPTAFAIAKTFDLRSLALNVRGENLGIAEELHAIDMVARLFEESISISGNIRAPEVEKAAPLTCDTTLTARQAADLLGYTSTRRVTQLRADGRLSGYKIEGRWIIDTDSLERFIEDRARKALNL